MRRLMLSLVVGLVLLSSPPVHAASSTTPQFTLNTRKNRYRTPNRG